MTEQHGEVPLFEAVRLGRGFDPLPVMRRDLSWRALVQEAVEPGGGSRVSTGKEE